MTDPSPLLAGPLALVFAAVLLVLLITWIFLPFAVFKMSSRVRGMEAQGKVATLKIGELRQALEDANAAHKMTNRLLMTLVEQGKTH